MNIPILIGVGAGILGILVFTNSYLYLKKPTPQGVPQVAQYQQGPIRTWRQIQNIQFIKLMLVDLVEEKKSKSKKSKNKTKK